MLYGIRPFLTRLDLFLAVFPSGFYLEGHFELQERGSKLAEAFLRDVKWIKALQQLFDSSPWLMRDLDLPDKLFESEDEAFRWPKQLENVSQEA